MANKWVGQLMQTFSLELLPPLRSVREKQMLSYETVPIFFMEMTHWKDLRIKLQKKVKVREKLASQKNPLSCLICLGGSTYFIYMKTTF